MDLLQEKELVEKAKKDEQSFILLYRHYYPQIYGYILKRLGSREAAEDVTSETFMRVVKNINKFEWQGYSFSSWIYRIATNEVNRYFAGHKSMVLAGEISNDDAGFWGVAEETPESAMMDREQLLQERNNFLMIRKALLQLPTDYQEVLSLRYFEGKKVGEIAALLGKKEGTVKSLLSRGIDKLLVVINKTGV